MVAVPAGTFMMGDGDPITVCGVDEREVTLTRAFLLARYETTNLEYLAAVQWAYDHGLVNADSVSVIDRLDQTGVELLDLDDTACEIAFAAGVFSLRDAGNGINPTHPVKEVSWYGAARYCDWLSLRSGLPRAYDHDGDWSCNGGDPYGAAGYRLPTDAEWEYAAQFDDGRIYPWGDDPPDCALANYRSSGVNCLGWSAPVGSYANGPDVLGELIYDLPGNVWEWCNDWHVCSLGTDPVTDPPGPPGGPGSNSLTTRVLRGGGWHNGEVNLRSANRDDNVPELAGDSVGFRCARTL